LLRQFIDFTMKFPKVWCGTGQEVANAWIKSDRIENAGVHQDRIRKPCGTFRTSCSPPTWTIRSRATRADAGWKQRDVIIGRRAVRDRRSRQHWPEAVKARFADAPCANRGRGQAPPLGALLSAKRGAN